MSELLVEGLMVRAGGEIILRGVDLCVRGGEVHAVMGPNGSGKSTLAHVLMGRSGYEVMGGRASLNGVDLLALSPFERAQAGLFLAMQHPTEVPGVSLADLLAEALRASAPGAEKLLAERLAVEAEVLGVPAELLERPVNVDFSGGEQKRGEALQLAVLRPAVAVLDEIDSGLDIDALRHVSRRIERAATEEGLGVLAITHFSRLLSELHADRVHILMRGRIAASGGPELADELERDGYERWSQPEEVAVSLGRLSRRR